MTTPLASGTWNQNSNVTKNTAMVATEISVAFATPTLRASS